jgi:hypothetical protein
MSKSVVFCCVLATGLFVGAATARAAVSYSYVADQPTYSYEVGSSTTVRLYLLETLTGGSTSLIQQDGGLTGGAMRVLRVPGPPDQANLGTFTYNAVDFSGPSDTPGIQTASQIAFRETGPLQGAQVMPGNSGGNAANAMPGAIYLGSVTISGGTPGLNTFSLSRYDPNTANGSGDTITSTHSYDLDVLSSANPAYTGTASSPTSFTVNVVPGPGIPEPGTGAAAGVAIAMALLRRRRRPVAA